MKKPLAVANWKMNKTLTEAEFFMKALTPSKTVELVVAPPAPYLFPLFPLAKKKRVALAAQNLSELPEGANTGELSPAMVNAWTKYVIVGHSERRAQFGETDESAAKKGVAAWKADIIPIFCVGENLETREQGQALTFVAAQVETMFENITKGWAATAVLAYEPIWAIGKAEAAGPDEVQDMHRYLRNILGHLYDEATANDIRIIYGGSTNPTNAPALAACSDVDGFLIGRSSLNVHSFEQLFFHLA